MRYLKDNFPPAEQSGEIPTITLYYDHNSLDSVKAFRPDLTFVKTPCIGMFNETSNTGLITGVDEYGLLTSTVNGMHSRLLFSKNWNPIHGAVIQIDDQGAVLIGHHGAGKSTALLNLIHHAKEIKKINVLTDDWSVARKEGASIAIQSIEHKMSFSESLVRKNQELDLMALYEQHALGGIGKLWIDIDEVLGNSIYIPATIMKKLLVFTPDQGEELITKIPIDTAAYLLVDSAYHMPDCGQGIKARQISFWTDVLDSIDCVQVNSRYSRKQKHEIYKELLDFILE